jgi:hypothetical protein
MWTRMSGRVAGETGDRSPYADHIVSRFSPEEIDLD